MCVCVSNCKCGLGSITRLTIKLTKIKYKSYCYTIEGVLSLILSNNGKVAPIQSWSQLLFGCHFIRKDVHWNLFQSINKTLSNKLKKLTTNTATK